MSKKTLKRKLRSRRKKANHGKRPNAQVNADNWYGIVSPANIPPAIAAKLHDKSVEALKSAEVTEKLGRQGVLTVGSSTATFTAYVKGEIQRWGGVVKAAGIKLK